MWNNLIVHIILVQLWVAGQKAQPSIGHMREKRPITSFRGHEDLFYCIKSGRVSGILVSGKNFPITKYCLTTLMTFKIPNITWDIGHYFNLYLGLKRLGWLYVLGIPPRAVLRLWTPQSTCHGPRPWPKLACGVRAGSLRATEPTESTRKDSRPEEEKMPKGQKNTFDGICM